jgi:hypothetical protein
MNRLIIAIISITCILCNRVLAEESFPTTKETNHYRKVIKKKNYHRLSRNPDLNKEEISKIIIENELEEEKVRIIGSSKECQYTAEEVSEKTEKQSEEVSEKTEKQSEEDRLRSERAELERQRDLTTRGNRGSIGGNFNVPSSSDEAAVILLVVIGAVVIIYWLATAPALLAKMANDDGCVQSLKHFFTEYNGYHFSKEHQNARSYSLEFDFYFKHKYENSIYYGFNAVLGSHTLEFAQGDDGTKQEDSTYFLIGPSLLFPMFSNETRFGPAINMDFLLGKSNSKEIESMAVGRLGFQYTSKSGLLWGFGVAGNKFSIDQNRSFYKDNSEFGLSTYFRLGFAF